jgi:hypothetical protein
LSTAGPSAQQTVASPRLGLLARFSDAFPSPLQVLFGSILWGTGYSLTILAGFWLRNGLAIVDPLPIAALYFYGAAAAFAPGLFLCNLFFRRKAPLPAAIATLLFLLFTHAVTAGLFALQYRIFYAAWHANFPSITWFFQLAFTSAAAVYQFTVTTLFSYLPGLPLLFAAYFFWFLRHRD